MSEPWLAQNVHAVSVASCSCSWLVVRDSEEGAQRAAEVHALVHRGHGERAALPIFPIRGDASPERAGRVEFQWGFEGGKDRMRRQPKLAEVALVPRVKDAQPFEVVRDGETFSYWHTVRLRWSCGRDGHRGPHLCRAAEAPGGGPEALRTSRKAWATVPCGPTRRGHGPLDALRPVALILLAVPPYCGAAESILPILRERDQVARQGRPPAAVKKAEAQ